MNYFREFINSKVYFCVMLFFKHIFNFYIHSSLHVAFAVYAFTRITELYFNLPYNESLDFFIFYGTISGYNFVKYAGVAKLHHLSLTNHLKLIQVFSLCCFVFMCYYAIKIPLQTILLFIPFGLLTFFYAIPFLLKSKKNIRSISGIKVFIIALVWSGVTVLIPVLAAQKNIDIFTFLYVLQRFLIVVVLTFSFDIRDLKYDTVSLKTIPQKIGIQKTKRLGLTLLICALVIEFLFSPTLMVKNSFIILFFILLLFLMNAHENQSKYYSSFWVEAIPIFWWGILLGILNFKLFF